MSIIISSKPFNKLGAESDKDGVNFAIHSPNSEYVELCLFKKGDEERIVLPYRTEDGVWHGHIKGLTPGQRYGYRVHGKYDPSMGHRFNPNKLLLDPYAKAFDGEFIWDNSLLAYNMEHGPDSFNTDDSAHVVPKCIVVDDAEIYKRKITSNPNIPWHQSIIYETHVKGHTILNKDVYGRKRGGFAGLSDKHTIKYLKSLGVTSVELLPIQACGIDKYLGPLGMKNYWGYDTVGFFAPRPSYGSILEFREMVNALHDAGIEVILDVVYNHTGDSDETGPTLLFKGIDNAYYYRLDNYNKALYKGFTGTGNVLDTNKPYVLRMIQDSLHYWAGHGVDGFRFDLTSALGRDETDNFSPNSQFLTMIRQDAYLRQLKLIAEPWDARSDGFALGNFPPHWRQWNCNYRECMRSLLSDKHTRKGDIATSLAGSDYLGNDEDSSLSINYITSHDGFTLNDFFSYAQKRNETNPWLNNDGPNETGYNCGVEGESKDKTIVAERYLRMRNSFALLLLSLGTPMICAGDEIARTQRGNNNAYCQDNEMSWLDWDIDSEQKKLFEFLSSMIKLRLSSPLLSRSTLMKPGEAKWYASLGEELLGYLWDNDDNLSMNYQLANEESKLFIVINMNKDEMHNVLPSGNWQRIMSTYDANFKPIKQKENKYTAKGLEIAVFESIQR